MSEERAASVTQNRTPDERDSDTPAESLRGLYTLQWAIGGLFDSRLVPGWDVCLIRATIKGQTGATLCGKDRFAKDVPGWSVRGGISGPGVDNKPCAACDDYRRKNYPDLPVAGLSGVFDAPHYDPWTDWSPRRKDGTE